MTTNCDPTCKYFERCDRQPDEDCYEPKTQRSQPSAVGNRHSATGNQLLAISNQQEGEFAVLAESRKPIAESPVCDLCVRALLTGDVELQQLACTLIALRSERLANRVALFAAELQESGLVSWQ